MSAALQLPENLNVGESLTIQGTGFANTQAYTAKVMSGRPGAPVAMFIGTTSGSGAVDTTGGMSVAINSPDNITVEVSDGTDTVRGTVRVWRT